MKNYVFVSALVIILQAPLLAVGQGSAPKAKPNSSASEPITLEFGNMKSEKPSLLKQAEYLKSISGNSGSVQYATQFVGMMQMAKRVGSANLSPAEADLLMSVPEPKEEAMAEFIADKEKARQRVQERTAAVDAAVAKWRAAKAEEAKLAEEKRQAEEVARIEKEKVDAMHRQAAAQEKMARAQASQAALMNRINGYNYYY